MRWGGAGKIIIILWSCIKNAPPSPHEIMISALQLLFFSLHQGWTVCQLQWSVPPHWSFTLAHSAVLLCQHGRLTSKLPRGSPTACLPACLPPPSSLFPPGLLTNWLPLWEFFCNKRRLCGAPWALEGCEMSQRALITPLRWFKGSGTCWPMCGTRKEKKKLWHYTLTVFLWFGFDIQVMIRNTQSLYRVFTLYYVSSIGSFAISQCVFTGTHVHMYACLGHQGAVC